MSFRIRSIQFFIDVYERLVFYPKLKRFYISKLLQKNINVIDVGANKGQTIDFFLKVNKNATIFSFEPNKILFNDLLSKYQSNKNIFIHKFGISNVKGELVFHENVMDETSTFEELNLASKYLEKKASVLGVTKENIITARYKVAVIRLVDFLKDHPKTLFDVLKIDVEGHELKCLQGLFNENIKSIPIRFIQLENHHDDMYLNNNLDHEIQIILNQNNFVKVAEIKHGFGDFAEIIYENKNKNEA